MITDRDVKRWSRMGVRATYGQILMQLIEERNDVYALSADLGGSSGLQRLMLLHPDRFLNVGIAEQNLIGVAAGLAKEGLIPFASSFAPFITLRCCEQIKMNMGYMKLNIKTVGLGSGLSMGNLGNSHYGIEDIAAMRAIPNLTIINPADCAEVAKAVYAAADYTGPVYIRLTGGINNPIVYNSDYDYTIGKADVLKEGKHIALIAIGSMVYQALQAADIMKQRGIDATVVNMHTVKPIDKDALSQICQNSNLIVTIEEHNIIGGLGSAVAEYVSEQKKKVILHRIGVGDQYLKAGDYTFLLNKYGMTAESIADKIMEYNKEI